MSNGAVIRWRRAPRAGSRAAERAAGTRTGFSPSRMFAVMRKELRSYFAFPLVYIISGIFTAARRMVRVHRSEIFHHHLVLARHHPELLAVAV